jgi:hypothetical protein
MSLELTERRVIKGKGVLSKHSYTDTRIEANLARKIKKLRVSMLTGSCRGISVKVNNSYVATNPTAPKEFDVKQNDDVFISILWDDDNEDTAEVLCEYSLYEI